MCKEQLRSASALNSVTKQLDEAQNELARSKVELSKTKDRLREVSLNKELLLDVSFFFMNLWI